ncbi:DUF4190 domain-containing protein [Hyalangium rubrum]|uniref:DUF4190 domain-containing protein n=1 Tax=Hyalangium rubrum TaxID=3103134 RepID=A0ABU5GYY9_9BACT|nr:DUF4190 domain-containing protein [Hyalangium sp. s54d21]MDY7226261.1 DUF4190 domain-containing protein [Hyalangium sp. s54d21]
MHEAPGTPPPACPFHPAQGTVVACHRCGVLTCVACLSLSGARGWCRSCEEHSRRGPASRRAVASGVLGSVGLCCAFAPGLLGLALGYAELRSIERGDSPRAGREWAKAGVVLGWMNVLMAVAVGLVSGWMGLSRS